MTPLPRIYLLRFETNSASFPPSAFGRWEDEEHKQLAVTVERPWENNQEDVSCIPAGTYRVSMRDSKKHHGRVYGIEDVPDRSDCEIHPANLSSQLLGCIALGTEFGRAEPEGIEPGFGVLNSVKAVDDFVTLMNGEPFELVVTDPTDTTT